MGGRGASSGIGAGSSKSPQALVITTNDGARLEFRKQANGVITDMGGTDVKDMNGRTFSDLKKFAKEKGYQVKEYTSKDLKKWDENYKADREATKKFLNENDGTMKPEKYAFKMFKNIKRAGRTRGGY